MKGYLHAMRFSKKILRNAKKFKAYHINKMKTNIFNIQIKNDV